MNEHAATSHLHAELLLATRQIISITTFRPTHAKLCLGSGRLTCRPDRELQTFITRTCSLKPSEMRNGDGPWLLSKIRFLFQSSVGSGRDYEFGGSACISLVFTDSDYIIVKYQQIHYLYSQKYSKASPDKRAKCSSFQPQPLRNDSRAPVL